MSRIGIEKICSVINRISGIALLFLVALLVLNILGRVVNHPIVGTYEAVQFGFAIMVCTTIAYTALKEAHIAIDLFFDRYPQKAKTILETISQLLGIITFSLITWRLWVDGLEAYRLKEQSSTLGLPVFLFQFGLAIGFGLLVLVIASQLWKRIGGR